MSTPREPTERVQVTIGQDVGLRGLDLVQRCADIEQVVRKEWPEIEWTISVNLVYATTTIKVEPDWPENYAEVNQIVGPLLA